MKINSEKLVRISTYAREKDVSSACVYLWIRNKEVSSVTIDGVIFIIKDELSMKKGKGVRLDKVAETDKKQPIEY